ncbi:hypothetical protein FOZ62_006035, partial [Perkinsus olseni]
MISLILPLLLLTVRADLPLHCTVEDAEGWWQLYLLEGPVPDWSNPAGQVDNFCGYTPINSNEGNIARGQQVQQLMDTTTQSGEELTPLATQKILNMTLSSSPVIDLHLSMDQEVSDGRDHHLKIRDDVGAYRGSWSVGYDEGLVLKHLVLNNVAPPRNMVAFFHYRCLGDNTHCGDYNDFENEFVSTNGYESLCGQTLIGWWNSVGGAKQGCFWMRKKSNEEANRIHNVAVVGRDERPVSRGSTTLSALIALREARRKAKASRSRALTLSMRGIDSGPLDEIAADEDADGGYADLKGRYHILSEDDYSDYGYDDEVPIKDPPQPADEACMNTNKIEDVNLMSSLPKAYDFREEFPNFGDLEAQQMLCGSCYAIGAVSALQTAIARQFQRVGMALPVNWSLSVQGALSCSYSSQGCNGGFPGIMAFDLTAQGVPPASCMPYQGTPESCDRSCYKDPKKLWYAKDFGYVGGFYGRCSEALIKQHIMENGPVSVAVNAQSDLFPRPPHNITGFDAGTPYGTEHSVIEGNSVRVTARRLPSIGRKTLDAHLFTVGSSFRSIEIRNSTSLIQGMTAKATSKRDLTLRATLAKGVTSWPHVAEELARILKSTGLGEYRLGEPQYLGIDRWEYTNHALLITGWGSEMDHEAGKEVDYWIARNSWGATWGPSKDGYVKILRGVNFGGIESQAVSIIPDPCRGAFRDVLVFAIRWVEDKRDGDEKLKRGRHWRSKDGRTKGPSSPAALSIPMRKRRSAVFALAVAAVLERAAADLPSHCTREDSKGKWLLYYLKGPVPDWRTDTGGNFCGYTAINTNKGNLAMGEKIAKLMQRDLPTNEDFTEIIGRAWTRGAASNHGIGMPVDGGPIEIELSLSQKIEDTYGEKDAHHLMILDASDDASVQLGHWSMGFDEFIILNNFTRPNSAESPRKIDLFVRYRCTGERECGGPQDAESPDGTTEGYVSYCGQTLVGFWSAIDESVQGCAWARKVDTEEANKIHSLAVPHREGTAGRATKILAPEYTVMEPSRRVGEVHAHVEEGDEERPVSYTGMKKRRYKLYEAEQLPDNLDFPFTKGILDRLQEDSPAKNDRHLDLCQTEELFEADRILATLPEEVRASYDFRQHYGDYGSPVKNQGPCGGCYAMGIAAAVQGAIYKDFTSMGIPIPDDFELSPQGILSCSYTAQACNGGFPGSVGFDLLVTGLTTERCMPWVIIAKVDYAVRTLIARYVFNDGKCKPECFHDERKVWYIKEGTYKGGFYGRCSMARIMQHVYEHGPMQVAIEAPNGLTPTLFHDIVSKDVHHVEPDRSTADL